MTQNTHLNDKHSLGIDGYAKRGLDVGYQALFIRGFRSIPFLVEFGVAVML